MLPFFTSLLFAFAVLLSLTSAVNVNVAPRAMVKTNIPVTVQGVPEGTIIHYTLYNADGVPIGGTSGRAGATAYIYIPTSSTGSATVEATDGITTSSIPITIYKSDDVSSPETNYKTHVPPHEEADHAASLQAGSRVGGSGSGPIAFTNVPPPTGQAMPIAEPRTKKLLKRRINFNA